MANEQNLIPNSKRTPKELREMTSKGGKRSGEVRRQQKTFRELFTNFLNKQVTMDKLKEQMEQFGFTDKEIINKNALVLAQFREAMNGNIKAFEMIRDTMRRETSRESRS